MALTTAQITALNNMCPACKDILIGTGLNKIHAFNEVAAAPTPSASNIGHMFFDGTNKLVYVIVDATTVKTFAFV